MDKKRTVARRRRYQKKKASNRFDRLDALEIELNKSFSGWEYPTPAKRHAGLMNLFEMAISRQLIIDIETFTPCSDQYCLDVAAACYSLIKKDERRQELL